MKILMTFNTNKGKQKGTMIRNNIKTVVVKTEDGNYIKRHKKKHQVSEWRADGV